MHVHQYLPPIAKHTIPFRLKSVMSKQVMIMIVLIDSHLSLEESMLLESSCTISFAQRPRPDRNYIWAHTMHIFWYSKINQNELDIAQRRLAYTSMIRLSM